MNQEVELIRKPMRINSKSPIIIIITRLPTVPEEKRPAHAPDMISHYVRLR